MNQRDLRENFLVYLIIFELLILDIKNIMYLPNIYQF